MAAMAPRQYDRYVTTTQAAAEAIAQKVERLRRQAQQCRTLADTAITPEGRKVLAAMALDYEQLAATTQTNGLRSHPSI